MSEIDPKKEASVLTVHELEDMARTLGVRQMVSETGSWPEKLRHWLASETRGMGFWGFAVSISALNLILCIIAWKSWPNVGLFFGLSPETAGWFRLLGFSLILAMNVAGYLQFERTEPSVRNTLKSLKFISLIVNALASVALIGTVAAGLSEEEKSRRSVIADLKIQEQEIAGDIELRSISVPRSSGFYRSKVEAYESQIAGLTETLRAQEDFLEGGLGVTDCNADLRTNERLACNTRQEMRASINALESSRETARGELADALELVEWRGRLEDIRRKLVDLESVVPQGPQIGTLAGQISSFDETIGPILAIIFILCLVGGIEALLLFLLYNLSRST